MKQSAFIVSALLLAQCRDKVPEKPVSEPAPAESPAPAETFDASPPPPPSDAGAWAESQHFRLRVLDVAPCDPPDQRERFRLGVTVEIAATEKATLIPVIVSPQGATLVKNGTLFQASINPRSTPSCEGPLAHQPLHPGKSAHGVFIFEAPSASYLEGALFTYKPPRWGGDLPLEVRLPDCFEGDCSDASAP